MRLHPDVVSTDTDDGAVLLHLATGRYWQLNTTGSRILDRLLAGDPPRDVADEVAGRFGLAPERARHDVSAFLEGMVAAKLVIPA